MERTGTEHSMGEEAPGKQVEISAGSLKAIGGTRSHQGNEAQARTACDETTGDETSRLMEEVLRRENLNEAYKRVKGNKGAPGIDRMTVEELGPYCQEHWAEIEEKLLNGSYKPQPVRAVEIPKPNGGTRRLGIPVVLDRLIMQAVLQVLTPRVDPTFSESSYGYRPGRRPLDAIDRSREYVGEGYDWVVDLDLEKFFDRVNHDIMMSRMARRIEDKRLLRLIRRYLQAGIMLDGVVSARLEGTPQGSPLSPLLSNILLDELDKELEKRGHRFCRYADDVVVYVKSEEAGKRVMGSLERFLRKRLRLRVNTEKSSVTRPWESKYLGYSFTNEADPRVRVSPSSIARLKKKLKAVWKKGRGQSIEATIGSLNRTITGWASYYRRAELLWPLKKLDTSIRRRIRSLIWRHWKRRRTCLKKLRRMGVAHHIAAATAYGNAGPWKSARLPGMHMAYPNKTLSKMGLKSLLQEQRRFAKSM